jgi:hypothetical protein
MTAQVGEQKKCRCGHQPPCQFYQKDWGPVNPLVLKPHVPKPRAKKAAEDLDDLDPERAPDLVDAQIEAEEAMDEGEAEQAVDESEAEESIDEGAMDEGSDGDMDSDEA